MTNPPEHQPPAADSSPSPTDPRTRWLMRYEGWLKLLARTEIESRFQARFAASDAVQQTLLEAWRCWDRFQGDDEPARLAWLRQILAHQLAQLARHHGATQKRAVNRELSLDQSLVRSADRLERLLAVEQTSPSERVQRHERQLRLAEVLERLPDDYRQVILLRNLEDLSHEEVAQRMNRTPGAVRMLWLRALAALRTELEQSPPA